MHIGCVCGNDLTDHTDFIPYKAFYIADQDYFDFIDETVVKISQRLDESNSATDLSESVSDVLFDQMRPYFRTAYQCRNCGRLLMDDPDNRHDAFQIFKPETETWKTIFYSVKGEQSKEWRRNLVGNWNPTDAEGQLWYDPPCGEKGGYEKFTQLESLQHRYFELFELFRSQNRLEGARLGITYDDGQVRDIHGWSARSTGGS